MVEERGEAGKVSVLTEFPVNGARPSGRSAAAARVGMVPGGHLGTPPLLKGLMWVP